MTKLYFRGEGIHLAERTVAYKLSDRLAESHPASHLIGAPNWAIMTRSDRQIDLSGALDTAETAARHDQKAHAAVVQYRATRPAEQAYVVMSLADFAQILKRDIEGAEA